MKILYCNIGDMKRYDGIADDNIQGGGSYNANNIGHEVNNFTNHNGMFYGFVQSNHDTIDIATHFDCPADSEYVEQVLVIWLVKKKYIVGFYKDARIYRKLQSVPDEAAKQRVYRDFNIVSHHAVLIPERDRRAFRVAYRGRTNIWYGNAEADKAVLEYVTSYEKKRAAEIDRVNDFTKPLIGIEKEAVVKQRVNQGQFRDMMLKIHRCKCCICGVTLGDMLIASHIKPWSKSDENEKVSEYNGLLLCPNHDKLFDLGYISFDEKGKIMISDYIDETNRLFLNVNPYMQIALENVSEEIQSFLKYHRSEIFKK